MARPVPTIPRALARPPPAVGAAGLVSCVSVIEFMGPLLVSFVETGCYMNRGVSWESQAGRAFFASRKRPTRTTKTANARRSRAGSRLDARRTPARAPSAAEAVKAAVEAERHLALPQVPQHARRRVGGDDEERRADRGVDRQPGEECERGDDEEAAADAEKAGEEADAEAGGGHRHRVGPRGPGASAGCPAQHQTADGQHQRGEEEQEDSGSDGVRGLGPERGPEHARPPEERGRPQVHPSRAGVDEAADEGGRAHDGERHADGRVDLDPRHVDEDGHREDRPAPAEEAERDTDERAQGEREDEVRRHRRILRLAWGRARRARDSSTPRPGYVVGFGP